MLNANNLSSALESACQTATISNSMDKLGKAAFNYVRDNLDITMFTTVPGTLITAAKCTSYTYALFPQPGSPTNSSREDMYIYMSNMFKDALQTMKFDIDTTDINYLSNGSFSVFTQCFGLDDINLLFTLTQQELQGTLQQIKKAAFDKMAARIIAWFQNTYTQLTGTVTTLVDNRPGYDSSKYKRVIGSGTLFTSELLQTSTIKIGSRISKVNQIVNNTLLYTEDDVTEYTEPQQYGIVTGIIPSIPIVGATYLTGVAPNQVPVPIISYAVSVQ